jgi:hypothetical protein
MKFCGISRIFITSPDDTTLPDSHGDERAWD